MIVDHLIDLFVVYISSGMLTYWIYPLLCIHLLGMVPVLIRWLTSWR